VDSENTTHTERQRFVYRRRTVDVFAERRSHSDFQQTISLFHKSQIAVEVVSESFTKGIGKRLLKSKMQRSFGMKRRCFFQLWDQDAREIETYGSNIRVVEEWSYFEDPDIEPKFFRLFRNFKPMSRSQWTIRATIG